MITENVACRICLSVSALPLSLSLFRIRIAHLYSSFCSTILARRSQSDIVNCMSNKQIKNRINEPLHTTCVYAYSMLSDLIQSNSHLWIYGNKRRHVYMYTDCRNDNGASNNKKVNKHQRGYRQQYKKVVSKHSLVYIRIFRPNQKEVIETENDIIL